MPTPTSLDRDRHAWLWAAGTVALVVSSLLAGYEPTVGDPDCLYRPIKSELAQALAQGTLPFWSDRFGLGAPLVAESHAAAFYPLNWVAYRVLTVSAAYRMMMWLHYLALAVSTFAYGRTLGLTPWGSALAAVSFTLCGFQASHACHEPFYHALPYLPLSLLLTERYMEFRAAGMLGCLALSIGAAFTLGHFQIPAWTAGLVLVTAAVRSFQGFRRDRNWVGLLFRPSAIAFAVGLGGVIALPQLGLTYELTKTSNFDRPILFLTYYSFPPMQWAQAVLPGLYHGFTEGVKSVYWASQSTTADEACFYVGTITLVLAVIGLCRRDDGKLGYWKWIAIAAFLLATMPKWWRDGFMILLRLPGLGHFRAPARYTLLTSFALCLFAGRGFDRAIPSRTFRRGLIWALVIGGAGFATAWLWSTDVDVARNQGVALRNFHFAFAAASWAIAIVVIVLQRRADLPKWIPLAVVALELGYLYYQGPTPWGRPIDVASDSPVFQVLDKESELGLIAGELQDLPVRAGLTVAYPNLGIVAPTPNYLLESSRMPSLYTLEFRNLYDRYGISHGVFEGDQVFRPGAFLYLGEDKVLDALLPSTRETRFPRRWRVERYPPPFPRARVARVARVVKDWSFLYPSLLNSHDPDIAWYMSADAPPGPTNPRAKNAKVEEWKETPGTASGVVEHDGDCDLVIRRTHYPGWSVSINGGPAIPARPAEGGLQSVRLSGAGRSRISMIYRPTRLSIYLGLSAAAVALCLTLIAARPFANRRQRSTKGVATA